MTTEGVQPASLEVASPRRAAPGPRSFRPDIQGLRALAVILVIGNHAHVPGMAGGFVGVDVFFVISGYVITQLLLRETTKGMRVGLSDFYSRRIRRIVPAATATLVVTLVVARWSLGPGLDPGLPGDVRWASLFAANLRFIATGSSYFVAGLHPSLITQFWSLGVEEQFYLCFPLVVFLIARMTSAGRRVTVLAVAAAVGTALSAWWSIRTSGSDPTTAYYSPLTRAWELGLGCLVATLTTRRPTRTARSEMIAAATGALMLGTALVTVDSVSVFPGWRAWLPCGATALFIWAGAGAGRTPVTRLLSTRPLGHIGDLSYSLYLTHFLWLALPEQLPTPLTGWPWRLLELGGTFLTAIWSYRLLENPVRRSDRLAADRVAVVLLLLVCVAAAWTTAALVSR